MPPPRKQKSHLQNASARCWSNTKISDPIDSSGDEYIMDVDGQELPFNGKFLLTNIGGLAEMYKSKCDARYLSTLLYMSLRFLDVKWEEIDRFLKNIGFITAQTSQKWTTVFIKGDFEEFSNDLRGGFYYTITDDETPMWNFPTQNPLRILMFHDESTFRSGEVSPNRWFFQENTPFFRKDAIEAICEDEWKQAVTKYKSLSEDSDVNYLSRTATASINIGTDAYFDNDTILSLWCNQKAFVRSRTDQSFEKMIKLIADSRIHFVERNIVLKLFRRFWRSIEAYSQGQTYGHVLKLFFSQLCKASVQSHRRISKKT
ncbi:unnamed protein product [Rotaria sordida]|uniref:Uncharacterized protein n=2 Tax=Rotaria sordida TaxID=392033 RepID=A0A819FLM9_9BILA|nr:unnamed protein product [Rotaria sordida]